MSFYDVVKKENIVGVRLRNYVKEKLKGVRLGHFTHIHVIMLSSGLYFSKFLNVFIVQIFIYSNTPHYKATFATFVYFEMTSIKIQKVKFGIFFFYI